MQRRIKQYQLSAPLRVALLTERFEQVVGKINGRLEHVIGDRKQYTSRARHSCIISIPAIGGAFIGIWVLDKMAQRNQIFIGNWFKNNGPTR